MRVATIFLLFIFGFCSNVQTGFAQELFSISDAVNDFAEKERFLLADNCPVVTDSLISSNQRPFDITFDPFTEFYIAFVYEPLISTSTDSFILMRTLPGALLKNFDMQSPDQKIKGVASDYYGNIYMVGHGLTKYEYFGWESSNGAYLYQADLPPNLYAKGGMTYRDGAFYYLGENKTLIQANVEDPAASAIVHTFPVDTEEFRGIYTVPYRCDSIETFVFTREELFSRIYRLDFTDFSLSEYCEYDFGLWGVGSRIESIIPPCELNIDLDADDSSGELGLDFNSPEFCVRTFQTSDSDLQINTQIPFDSVIVTLVNPSDNLQEFLSHSLPAPFTSSLPWGHQLIIKASAPVSSTGWQAALSAINYSNDAINPTYGPRTISFQAFGSFYSGTVARTTLNFTNVGLPVDFVQEDISCTGLADGQIFLNPTNGVAPYDYNWDNGLASNPIQSNLGPNIYSVTVTDDIGCSQMLSFEIIEPEELTVDLQYPSLTVCTGTGDITALVNGGRSPYSYFWSNGSSDPTIPSIESSFYEVTVTDDSGCISTASVSFNLVDAVADTAQINLCEGEVYNYNGQQITINSFLCDNFLASNGCDSTYCIDLSFTPAIVFEEVITICPGESYDFLGEEIATPGSYERLVDNGNPCEDIYRLELAWFNVPSSNIELQGNFCIEGSAILNSSDVINPVWSTGEITSSIEVQTDGWYFLEAMTTDGCTVQDSIFIEEQLNADIRLSTPICEENQGASVLFSDVSGGVAPYIYYSNNSSSTNPLFEDLAPGIYDFVVEDAQGCRYVETLEIDFALPGQINGPEDYTTRLGVELTIAPIFSFNPQSTTWLSQGDTLCIDCLELTFTPTSSQVINLIAIDENGCRVEWQASIIIDTSIDLYLPNVFSPNNDGINDRYEVFPGPSIAQILDLQIYDRWGSQVYQSTNIPWDGTIKGQEAIPGVYVVFVKVERIDGEIQVEKIAVTLIR